MIPSDTIRCEYDKDTNDHCCNTADTVINGNAYCNRCGKLVQDAIKIKEACNFVAELIKKIAKTTNQEGLFGQVHVEDKDWPYDSCVELMTRMPNGGEFHTGYCISPVIEQRAMTLGGDQKDFVRYYVQHEEVTKGVYRYADGSGEPDTSDLVDDMETDSPYKATTKAVILYIELEINQMFEAEAEVAMVDQMGKDEAELEAYYHEQDVKREMEAERTMGEDRLKYEQEIGEGW